jgi:4-aminobutyrate aminotransferase-like enzyme
VTESALQERHALIGTVHGRGLHQGVELVRDRTTPTPAIEDTARIGDRMLELGVVVQPAGDRQNIFTVKPPLCIAEASADAFLDALDRAPTDGW